MLTAFYTDHFVLPLPERHRFPMRKYGLLRERLKVASWARRVRLAVPDGATDRELSLAHDADYIRRVVAGELTPLEVRRIGFPWSPDMVERSRRSVGATIAAARCALRDGFGASLAGGTHHAFAESGQGYCVFNDVAVAIRVLQGEGAIRRAAVLDCDVHQGNGTAAIFAHDPDVFTCSLHGARNFPFRKCAGDLDIGLDDGAGDGDYLAALGTAFDRIPWTDSDVVFYLAGADPYAKDRLGRLRLSKRGLAERDRQVFRHTLALSVPTVVVMAGGYAAEIQDIVDIHAATIRYAAAAVQIAASRATRPSS